MKISAKFLIALSVTAGLGLTVPARGQEWRSDLVLYGWAAGLDGNVGVGSFEADVDKSFSDVVSDLEFGAMAGYAATNGRWVVLADAVIANLGTGKKGNRGILRADADVDMTLLEADFGYTVGRGTQLFVGARYLDLSSRVDLTVANQLVRAEGNQSWVDPVIGFRIGRQLADRWGFWLRADVGGFGVGSDQSWNAVAAVSYRVSNRVSVGGGYRILDVKYDDGTGPKRFLYDVQMDGPAIGLIFSF
jgi:hypothetical protein